VFACCARWDVKEFVEGEDAGFTALPAWEESVFILIYSFGVIAYPSGLRGTPAVRGGKYMALPDL
jgi:hypothetical protein